MLCDAEDVELLQGRAWRLERCYAITGVGWNSRTAHSILMGKPPRPGLTIDHINGVRTDNRRFNLRWATKPQQMANRRRRGRNRKRSDDWRGIWIDAAGRYCYVYDRHAGGPFADASECRDAMNMLALLPPSGPTLR